MRETVTFRQAGGPVASRWGWWAAGLVVVLFAAAVALVRLLDRSVQAAQREQLRREGRLVPVPCADCAGLGAQVLAWVSDWRALLVFVVLLAAAAAGGVISSGPHAGGGRRRLAS